MNEDDTVVLTQEEMENILSDSPQDQDEPEEQQED